MRMVHVTCPYCGNQFMIDIHLSYLKDIESTPQVIECCTTETSLPFGEACGRMFAAKVSMRPSVQVYKMVEAGFPTDPSLPD